MEWDISQRFKSNGGWGPLSARILSVCEGRVYMERWRGDAARAVRFDLPVTYFRSSSCGWKAVPRASDE